MAAGIATAPKRPLPGQDSHLLEQRALARHTWAGTPKPPPASRFASGQIVHPPQPSHQVPYPDNDQHDEDLDKGLAWVTEKGITVEDLENEAA